MDTVEILFFGDSEAESKNFNQNSTVCPAHVLSDCALNHCCSFETQEEDTFGTQNSVTFVRTFLIGRAIRHFRFFRMQDFCSNLAEVIFAPTTCTYATIGH